MPPRPVIALPTSTPITEIGDRGSAWRIRPTAAGPSFVPRTASANFPDNFGANGGALERNHPFFTISLQTTPTPYTPFYRLSQGLPAPIVVATTPGGTVTPPPGFGVFFVSQNFRQDVAQVW